MARKNDGAKPPKNMNLINAGTKQSQEEILKKGNTWEKDYGKMAKDLKVGNKEKPALIDKIDQRKEELKKQETTKEAVVKKDKDKDKDK